MNDHDDIERLLARLEAVEPPPDFTARVLARVRRGEVARWKPWQQAIFALLYVAALLALAFLAFTTGAAMEHRGVRELVQLAARDIAVVKDSPETYLRALAEAMPWGHLLALAIDAAVLGTSTWLLLRASPTRPPASAGA
jgi:hypothetical protein